MEYVVVVLVLIVGAAIGLGLWHVRQENAPGERPSLRTARRMVQPSVRVASGDQCACGGTIGRSGKTSPRLGDLLGCTACDRTWTLDGRRVIRRRVQRVTPPAPEATAYAPEPTDYTPDA